MTAAVVSTCVFCDRGVGSTSWCATCHRHVCWGCEGSHECPKTYRLSDVRARDRYVPHPRKTLHERIRDLLAEGASEARIAHTLGTSRFRVRWVKNAPVTK